MRPPFGPTRHGSYSSCAELPGTWVVGGTTRFVERSYSASLGTSSPVGSGMTTMIRYLPLIAFIKKFELTER